MEGGIIRIHESDEPQEDTTKPNETQTATYVNIEKLMRYLEENETDSDDNHADHNEDNDDDDIGPCKDINELLKSGADVNALDSDGDTALLQEIHKGHDHCAKLLIRAGARVSTVYGRGRTALMTAAEEGHVACVRNLMFVSGAGVNQIDANGETALVKAYRHGHPDCVELLLEAGADVNIVGVTREELFTWLEEKRQQEIEMTISGIRKSSVFTRASRGASVYANSLQLSLVRTPPDGASVKRDRKTFTPRTSKGVSVKRTTKKSQLSHGDNILHPHQTEADVNDAQDIVRRGGSEEITSGFDSQEEDTSSSSEDVSSYFSSNEEVISGSGLHEPITSGSQDQPISGSGSSLIEAAKRGNENMLEQLIEEEGTDVNETDVNGETSLYHAVSNNYTGCVTLLIQMGASVNVTGRSHAVALMHTEVVHEAPECEGLYANLPEITGSETGNKRSVYQMNQMVTALMIATVSSNSKTVQALLKAGADVNASEIYEATALMCAAWRGDTELVEALIKAGADVNASTDYKYTALLFAVNKGSNRCVGALMTAGAAVNAADSNGNTALLWALAGNNFKCVQYVLCAGADMNAANTDGYSAQTHVLRREHNAKYRELFHLIAESTVPNPTTTATRNLKQTCRAIIRGYLINRNPGSNLMYSVPRLRLPDNMANFLLLVEEIPVGHAFG